MHFSVAQNSTYKSEIDVKLGTATNFSMMIWGIPISCKTFDASDGLNTSTFTTVSINYTHTTTGAYFELNIGAHYLNSSHITPVPAQQTVGTAIVKNIKVSDISGFTVTLASNLTVTGNIHADGTLTSSDKLLKEDLKTLSPDTCLSMLENIDAKTYTRIDMGGVKRVGFIANDIQANLPDECDNVLGNSVYNGNAILTLDYSRLTPFLWQIAKNNKN